MTRHFPALLFILMHTLLVAGFAFAEDNPELTLTEKLGAGGVGYRDGAIAEAVFNQPQGLDAFTTNGLVVADTFNHCVRIVDFVTGTVTTDLGVCTESGIEEDTGGSLLAKSTVRLSYPIDVAVDSRTNDYFVLDAGNRRVIRVGSGGCRILAAGKSTPLLEPTGLAYHSPTGQLFVAEPAQNAVYAYDPEQDRFDRIAGSGFPGYDTKDRDALESRLNGPTDVAALDVGGRLAAVMIADTDNGLIRWIRPGESVDWLISNFAGGDNATVWRQTEGAAQLFRLEHPYRLVIAGNNANPSLYIAQPVQNRILGITLQRMTFFAAGEGAKEDARDLDRPFAIATSGTRNIWVFDASGYLKRFRIGLQ